MVYGRPLIVSVIRTRFTVLRGAPHQGDRECQILVVVARHASESRCEAAPVQCERTRLFGVGHKIVATCSHVHRQSTIHQQVFHKPAPSSMRNWYRDRPDRPLAVLF